MQVLVDSCFVGPWQLEHTVVAALHSNHQPLLPSTCNFRFHYALNLQYKVRTFTFLIMDLDDKAPKSLWQPLDAQRQEIRLIRVIPEAEQTTIHCQLEKYSLLDLSHHFSRFTLERFGDDLDGTGIITALRNAGVRKRWSSRNELGQMEPLRRIICHQPGVNLHRFIWGDFACLSYVWGNPTETRSIVVNGKSIEITENLGHALQQFRQDGMFCDQFLLWVDALCINQHDSKERADEVQRMKDIYGAAWTVEAWIGPDTINSNAGFQLLRDMATFRKAGCERELEKCLRQDPVFLGNTGWLGLHNIMDRNYWYRLWVIQEIVMGGSSVWIWCGPSMIDWETFCDGISTLQEYLWLVKDRCLNLDVHIPRTRFEHAWATTSLHLVYQDLATLSKVPLASRPEHAFGRLLDLSNSAQCSDMRDKVYALLALFPAAVARLIRPDYAGSLSRVFSQVSQAFIQTYANLEPLREGNPWGPSRCPSWVADWFWEGRIRHCRLEHPLWGPTYLFPRTDQDDAFTPYCASGNVEASFSFTMDHLELTCTGFIVDRITGLSAAGAGYFRWNISTIAPPESWHSAYGGFEATQEALMRTLLMDRVRFGKKPSRRHRAILHLPAKFVDAGPQFVQRGWTWLAEQQGYYFRWEGFRRAIAEFPLGGWAFNHFFNDDIPTDANEYDYTEVYAAVERSVKKKRFMTTENGFMGWAPDNMFAKNTSEQTQTGDLIAIVFGCSTPLAIRPHGHKFQVLGEAYVQGLMDGEAMCECFEVRSFTFC